KSGSVPSSASSTDDAPGPGCRPEKTGTTSRSTSAKVVTSSMVGAIRTKTPSALAYRAELTLLPAGERVDEIGETVAIRHDRALRRQPGCPRRGDTRPLGPPDHCAPEAERAGAAALTPGHRPRRRFA